MKKKIIIEITDIELATLVCEAIEQKLKNEGELPWENVAGEILVRDKYGDPVDFSLITVTLEEEEDDDDDDDNDDTPSDTPDGEVITVKELEGIFSLT